mmetsp:Transcript_42913/g.82241  ORF Transcript_42913/g.82241 Transcript_42913/m.82241 type:complete len:994 (-) Transcript_42913:56-3037(-)
MVQSSKATGNPNVRRCLAGDAFHVSGLFAPSEPFYRRLLAELQEREQCEGVSGTYWQHSSSGRGVSVTRVRRPQENKVWPEHRIVIERLAEYFQVDVEGWWVNHYSDGTDIKGMHRDGWGRQRGVNVTVGASFGAARTLRFEPIKGGCPNPQSFDCLQQNGDAFAFGSATNNLYKHGVPSEPGAGPRISLILMGRVVRNWSDMLARRVTMSHPPLKSPMEKSPMEAAPQRRWGRCTNGGPLGPKGTLPSSACADSLVDPTVVPAEPVAPAAPIASSIKSSSTLSWRGNRRRDAHYADPKEATAPDERDDCGGRGSGPCIVWLRDDLRLTDNPALHAALELGCIAVLPLFIHDVEDPCPCPLRGAALWWKGESLKAFDRSLRESCDSRLIVRLGVIEEELAEVAHAVGASCVCFNRMVEPWYRERDLRVEAFLRGQGLRVKTFQTVVLQEPWKGSPPMLLQQGPGEPKVAWEEVAPGRLEPRESQEINMQLPEGTAVADLTLPEVVSIVNADRLLSNPNPCAQLLTALGENENGERTDHRRRDPDHFLVYQDVENGSYSAQPLPSVRGCVLPCPRTWPASLNIEELGYHVTMGNGFPADGMPQYSEAALQHENAGCARSLLCTSDGADAPGDWAAGMKDLWRPGEDAALSKLRDFVANIECHKRPDRHRADLRNTSLLSPHLRFGEVSPRTCYAEAMRAPPHLRHGFVRRLLWRDLSYAELYRWPGMATMSQRLQYEEQSWTGSLAQLRCWQRGQTGFPLIDAAMRQLWREGYINNYMRHVTATFLIDYLDISWKEGFKWYDYTLVDSDVAINARLWQQGGHSGISQWNFVLHPVYAAKNADPTGDYVRRWVPELAVLPTEFIHCPWEAAGELLAQGIKLGVTYPRRCMLDIDSARRRHLAAIQRVRRAHPETISEDGTECLLLRDGSRVLLRTRDDIRRDTEELVVAQAPDGILHKRRFASSGVKSSPQQLLLDAELYGWPSTGRLNREMHIL